MSMDFKPRYCTHCNNTGMIDCYCGGDLCLCENNGEEPCRHCDQTGMEDDDDFYCEETTDPEMLVRDTGDELGQVLADALSKKLP